MIDGTTLREVRRRRDWTQAHLATVVDIPASVLSAYERGRREPSLHAASRTIRVLCPEDLAVFKAMFDRPKDWVDIATMVDANALDVELAAERLARVLGTDDARVDRLRHLAQRRTTTTCRQRHESSERAPHSANSTPEMAGSGRRIRLASVPDDLASSTLSAGLPVQRW